MDNWPNRPPENQPTIEEFLNDKEFIGREVLVLTPAYYYIGKAETIIPPNTLKLSGARMVYEIESKPGNPIKIVEWGGYAGDVWLPNYVSIAWPIENQPE